jgi:hypothetical protein
MMCGTARKREWADDLCEVHGHEEPLDVAGSAQRRATSRREDAILTNGRSISQSHFPSVLKTIDLSHKVNEDSHNDAFS